MSTENDDFVEGLLKGLPKAEPISEIELRKFEKLIDRQADEFKKSKRASGFRIPASIAASVVIVFGAAFLLSNHGKIIKSDIGITHPSSPPASANPSQNSGDAHSNTMPSQVEESPKPGNSKGSNGSTEMFGKTNSSNSEGGNVAKYESNLDYSTSLDQIKKIVILGSKPGSLSSLTNAEQECAIKQGLSSSLLAIDKGYYQTHRVSAYFSGSSKGEYKIVLVDAGCLMVAEL